MQDGPPRPREAPTLGQEAERPGRARRRDAGRDGPPRDGLPLSAGLLQGQKKVARRAVSIPAELRGPISPRGRGPLAGRDRRGTPRFRRDWDASRALDRRFGERELARSDPAAGAATPLHRWLPISGNLHDANVLKGTSVQRVARESGRPASRVGALPRYYRVNRTAAHGRLEPQAPTPVRTADGSGKEARHRFSPVPV